MRYKKWKKIEIKDKIDNLLIMIKIMIYRIVNNNMNFKEQMIVIKYKNKKILLLIKALLIKISKI